MATGRRQLLNPSLFIPISVAWAAKPSFCSHAPRPLEASLPPLEATNNAFGRHGAVSPNCLQNPCCFQPNMKNEATSRVNMGGTEAIQREAYVLCVACLARQARARLCAEAAQSSDGASGVVEASLGPPVVPFYPFLGEGAPTKIDYRKKAPLF